MEDMEEFQARKLPDMFVGFYNISFIFILLQLLLIFCVTMKTILSLLSFLQIVCVLKSVMQITRSIIKILTNEINL